MEWHPDEITRLYELYLQHADQVRAGVVQANRTLGSACPEITKLDVVGPTEFERLITEPNDEPNIIRRWVQRIIRGHEAEFPKLDAA